MHTVIAAHCLRLYVISERVGYISCFGHVIICMVLCHVQLKKRGKTDNYHTPCQEYVHEAGSEA